MVDLSLLAAAACFGAVTAVGAAVSMHEDIPGEPLGWRVPGRVPVHLAACLGSGLSAPWPMPVATLLAGLLARPGSDVARARLRRGRVRHHRRHPGRAGLMGAAI